MTFQGTGADLNVGGLQNCGSQAVLLAKKARAACMLQLIVKNVPVNYAMRFNGPVTALTARRVGYGVGTRSICQADPLAVIKP